MIIIITITNITAPSTSTSLSPLSLWNCRKLASSWSRHLVRDKLFPKEGRSLTSECSIFKNSKIPNICKAFKTWKQKRKQDSFVFSFKGFRFSMWPWEIKIKISTTNACSKKLWNNYGEVDWRLDPIIEALVQFRRDPERGCKQSQIKLTINGQRFKDKEIQILKSTCRRGSLQQRRLVCMSPVPGWIRGAPRRDRCHKAGK